MVYVNEENKVINAENNSQYIAAYSRIPYGLISQEIDGNSQDMLAELTQICRYYDIYKNGAKFHVEGTNGDYVPANLKYKIAASLINKEARFMFAEAPDITITAKSDVGIPSQEAKDSITNLNEMVRSILDENMFESILVKAAKDCFIGKRVAGIVNFNMEDGVTITFLPSTQFIHETKPGNPHVLTKFVCFMVIKNSITLKDKVIFKKKYTLEDGIVYLEEYLYDGAGALIEEVTAKTPIKLKSIPAFVFVNDGLTGDEDGESEIELLSDYESWYSKMANGDLDSERKSMNPIRYTIDMDNNSTKNLSSSAGSFWDLMSDQNLDSSHPSIGMLESSMGYSQSLDTSLNRLKVTSYEAVDVPNINLETMIGSITSGKALKAIYWPLIVRCKEKMKIWGPQLRKMVEVIVQGAWEYPECVKRYVRDNIPVVDYTVVVVQNTPLPEDEIEEKSMDLSEVAGQTMSRKSYMMKWRGLSEEEVQEELEQMAAERQLIDDAGFPGNPMAAEDDLPY